MDEQDLRDRLMAAAETDQPQPALADDLARGRRSRRHRAMAVSGTALATAVVLGTSGVAAGLAIHQSGTAPQSPLGAVDNGWSSHQTRTTPKTHSTPKKVHHSNPLNQYGDETTWTNDVFLLGRQDLDPAGQYASHTMNIQSGSDGAYRSLGTRITWSQAGDSGEGQVAVLLASPGSPRYAGSCSEFGPCVPQHSPEFGDYLLSGDPSAGIGFEVIVTQADGEIADITVDPLYGNNSLTPTIAPLPTLDQVLTFAEDSDLNLPLG